MNTDKRRFPVLHILAAVAVFIAVYGSMEREKSAREQKGKSDQEQLDAAYRQIRPKPGDTSLARRRVIFDSLLAALSERGSSVKNAHGWRRSADIPRHWVMVRMTDTSFIIYDPCDGRNPEIIIGDDSVTVVGTLESETHVLDALHRDDKFHAGIQMLTPTYEDSVWNMRMILLDFASGLSLWNWYAATLSIRYTDPHENDQILMIPADHAHLLPLIKHPCSEFKEIEYQFLNPP